MGYETKKLHFSDRNIYKKNWFDEYSTNFTDTKHNITSMYKLIELQKHFISILRPRIQINLNNFLFSKI